MNSCSYDKTNESAYKYLQSVSDEVTRICEPLALHSAIKMFGYGRVFFDGRYIAVNNQPYFSKCLFQFILQENSNLFENTAITIPSYTGQIVPLVAPTSPNSSHAMRFRYEKGFWPPCFFIRTLSDSIEYWCFWGGKDHSNNIQEFFTSHQKCLLKFVHFFNASAENMIKYSQGDEHKLGFYKCGNKALETVQLLNCSSITANTFLEDLRKKSKYLHKIKPELTYLTPREQECLSFLAKGDTAKEVARNLEISPRTVETHLKAIKYKTGFHSCSQLIKFFLNHFS